MQIPDEILQHTLMHLRGSGLFAIPPSSRPMSDLWQALNGCLLDLRQPLYHKRLNKKPPKAAAYHIAIRKSLCLLTGFAELLKINQLIVRSSDGWIDAISPQPRPYGMHWTARHAIDPPEKVFSHHSEDRLSVTVEDMLHLAAKVVYAVSGHNAGELPSSTATITFLRESDGVMNARVIIRQLSGEIHRAYMPLNL